MMNAVVPSAHSRKVADMNSDSSLLDTPSGQLAAVLTGGPLDIPTEQRECSVDPEDGKIKLPHRGGYEHFERTEERAGEASGDRLVFRWVGRTRVAE
jgi:hypothetical protein